jgi:uncharacterized lipoprotein YmbA
MKKIRFLGVAMSAATLTGCTSGQVNEGAYYMLQSREEMARPQAEAARGRPVTYEEYESERKKLNR